MERSTLDSPENQIRLSKEFLSALAKSPLAEAPKKTIAIGIFCGLTMFSVVFGVLAWIVYALEASSHITH